MQTFMEHNISLITTISAAFGTALILGVICERVRIPALVGYLRGGILIGPATRALSRMSVWPRSFPRSASCS